MPRRAREDALAGVRSDRPPIHRTRQVTHRTARDTDALLKTVGTSGPISQVAIFEIAVAPQIDVAIVAIEHKLDPELVTLMVGIGTPP